MAKPTTRDELAEYCLRALGAPVIEINIDEDQVDDRIDEAIQFYQEYHADAIVRTFVKHQITADDLVTNTIEVPESIISITRLIGLTDTHSNSMFSMKYQMHLNDVMGLNGSGGDGYGSLLNYEMTKQYLSLIDDVINGHGQQLSFSRHKNTVKIHIPLKDYVEIDQYLIFECFQTVNPNLYSNVYNDMALKELLTLLLKKQWGSNLI